MGRGGLGGEEVAAGGERSPADGGDEWRERIGVRGAGRGEGKSGDELERAGVDDRN